MQNPNEFKLGMAATEGSELVIKEAIVKCNYSVFSVSQGLFNLGIEISIHNVVKSSMLRMNAISCVYEACVDGAPVQCIKGSSGPVWWLCLVPHILYSREQLGQKVVTFSKLINI